MSARKRPYRMTRRAELEEETRRRIAESAVALHQQLGPARTTVSAIAELAGVRRSTVYRHFPDEEALFAACSAHWRAANPSPDPGKWAAVDDPSARTRAALADLYAYYARTHAMYTSLLRDEAAVPAVRSRLRDFHGYLASITDILMSGRRLRGRLADRTRAAIGHALSFPTWSSLVLEQGLSETDAVSLMSLLVESARDARNA